MIERFKTLWKRMNADGDPKEIYEEINFKYSAVDRVYHNMMHVEQCLMEFDSVRDYVGKPDLFEFVLWMHDVEHSTNLSFIKQRGISDEEASALIAENTLLKACVSTESIDYVTDRIKTTDHKQIPLTTDDKFIIDIDLSIFGKSKREFDEYAKKIREEYSHVPMIDYRNKRISILNRFINTEQRSHVFYTGYFQDKYENSARDNIKRTIIDLSRC